MAKVYVEIINLFDECKEARELLLQAGVEVIENRDQPFSTIEDIQKVIGDIDGVITGGACKWDERIFNVAPKLKVIAKTGKGLDCINLQQAKQYGITVTNTASANASAVAEHTLGMMLSLLRHIPYQNNEIKNGRWTKLTGRELAGKTVGLIGFGVIPQFLAKRLLGFDVKVLAYDKYPNIDAGKLLNVKFVELDELLRTSDLVSTHVPGGDGTYHMMDKEKFEKMKVSALFISMARGSVVNEADLYEALVNGKIAGAALDVFEQEPVTEENLLLKLKNVIVTPHCGGTTLESVHDDCMLTSQAILDVLNNEIPKNKIV